MLQLKISEHMYISFSHFEADQLTRNRFLKMTIFKNDSLWVTISSYQYTTTTTQLLRLFAVDRDKFRMFRVSISDFRPKSAMTHNESSVSPKIFQYFSPVQFFLLFQTSHSMTQYLLQNSRKCATKVCTKFAIWPYALYLKITEFTQILCSLISWRQKMHLPRAYVIAAYQLKTRSLDSNRLLDHRLHKPSLRWIAFLHHFPAWISLPLIVGFTLIYPKMHYMIY